MQVETEITLNFNLPFTMPLGYSPSDYTKINLTVSLFGSCALGQKLQRTLWGKKQTKTTRKLCVGADKGLTGWVHSHTLMIITRNVSLHDKSVNRLSTNKPTRAQTLPVLSQQEVGFIFYFYIRGLSKQLR